MANRKVFRYFDCLVTSVAMDERFMLVGQEDGNVAAYWWNGGEYFENNISRSEITAVSCEEEDEASNHIFYAGDTNGILYTLDKKGNVLAQGKARNEKIHTILSCGKFAVAAYSKTGWTIFNNTNEGIKADHSSTNSAEYSLDGDGMFHMDEDGQYHVNRYNCYTPTSVIATCRLEFTDDDDYAYAIVDPSYNDSLDTAEDNLLPVFKDDNEIRTLKFEYPVIQVMSRRRHVGNPADEFYFLLRNNLIVRMKGSDIENKEIKTEDLDKKVIDLGVGEYNFKGFAVYGSSKGTQICFQGTNEIFAINPDEEKE